MILSEIIMRIRKPLTAKQQAAQSAASLRWYHRNREHAMAQANTWKRANKEQQQAYQKAYDEKNKVKRIAKNKLWRINNPGYSSANSKKNYTKNKELYRPTRKAWQAANPDMVKSHSHNRRARLQGAQGNHTAAEWRSVLKAHGFRCGWCGAKETKSSPLTRDHYIPLARGGSNYANNLVPACRSCNCKKHWHDPIKFAQSIGLLL
jgi:5-methylcytosine-specific restriction endonuclease McrA